MKWITPKNSILYNYLLPDVSLPVCDLAYLAGFFDGQGNFRIYQKSNRSSYFLQFVYRSSDYDTLRLVADIFEGNAHPHMPSINMQIWGVTFTSRKAYRIFKQIYPFLIIRREAAEICMRFLEQYWRPGRKRISKRRQLIGAGYAALLEEHQLKSWPRGGKNHLEDSGAL